MQACFEVFKLRKLLPWGQPHPEWYCIFWFSGISTSTMKDIIMKTTRACRQHRQRPQANCWSCVQVSWRLICTATNLRIEDSGNQINYKQTQSQSEAHTCTRLASESLMDIQVTLQCQTIQVLWSLMTCIHIALVPQPLLQTIIQIMCHCMQLDMHTTRLWHWLLSLFL